MPLNGVPIVEHHSYDPSSNEMTRVDQVVEQVQREFQLAQKDAPFRHLVPVCLKPAPTVHLDDYSAIGGIEGRFDVRYLQDRARLRAAEGDIVISTWPETPGYEDYCHRVLGLGTVTWIRPTVSGASHHITGPCWKDRDCRRELISAARSNGLRYVHPHMGSLAAWELADLIHRASRQPIHVIAPPPELCRLVNNKVIYSRIVETLLGEDATPPTRSAWNQTSLTTQVRELACECAKLGIKLPDSAGGRGNVVLNGRSLHECSNDEVFNMLGQILKPIQWDGQQRLLVDCWETNVLSSPSVQLWISPRDDGPPILEGLFDQQMAGVEQRFVGARSASLTTALREDLVARSTLLAYVFQRLGYVGRCSFDAIVAGKDQEHGRVEFIECNGRWGGTSLPMTLTNRLCGDWHTQPFVTAHIETPWFGQVSFTRLLDWFHEDLFRRATGQGSIVFFTPGRMTEESAIDVLVIGKSHEDAAAACEAFADQLQQITAATVSIA